MHLLCCYFSLYIKITFKKLKDFKDFTTIFRQRQVSIVHKSVSMWCCWLCEQTPWGRSSTSAVQLQSFLSFMKEHKFRLWFMASCRLVGGHQHFRETCSPHFQDKSELSWEMGRLYRRMTGQCKPGMMKRRQGSEQANWRLRHDVSQKC